MKKTLLTKSTPDMVIYCKIEQPLQYDRIQNLFRLTLAAQVMKQRSKLRV